MVRKKIGILGIITDSCLSWNDHITETRTKLNSIS